MGDSEKTDQDTVKNLVSLHTAEYSALMSRATTYVTLQAGLWPLIGIYLALIAQLSRPSSASLATAFHSLLLAPLPRALFFWGNLTVIGIILHSCSQLNVEQFRIVAYIECRLRATIRDLNIALPFWGYEQFLFEMRGKIPVFNYSITVGFGVVSAAIGVLLLRHPTRYDSFGLAEVALFLMLRSKAHQLTDLRRKWQRCR